MKTVNEILRSTSLLPGFLLLASIAGCDLAFSSRAATRQLGDLDEDGWAACPPNAVADLLCDCDDSAPDTFPGDHPDDPLEPGDENCDGIEEKDADRDGYLEEILVNGETVGDDCNDQDPTVHPGATERCDGMDNDCNGMVDELEDPAHAYLDDDHDGQCDKDLGGTDCDDEDPATYQGAREVCNQHDDDCDGEVDEGLDQDGDGFCTDREGGTDCDDQDPESHPGAVENCNPLSDGDCDGATDDTIWLNGDQAVGFRQIQDALDEATDGDVIDVSCEGVYPGPVDFSGKAVLLRSTAGPAATVISGPEDGPVISFLSGEGPDAVLEGFTVTGGGGSRGGGICIAEASPTLRKLVVSGNTADEGGGIHIQDGAPWLEDVVLDDNYARSAGGGIYLSGDLSPTFVSVEIRNNWAPQGGGLHVGGTGISPDVSAMSVHSNEARNGGGIYIGAGASVVLRGMAIQENAAWIDGGGISVSDGATLLLEGVSVERNVCEDGFGGGIQSGSGFVVMRESTLSSNIAFEGGGLHVSSEGSVSLYNVTVSRNSGRRGGGVRVQGAALVAKNVWISGNFATNGEGGGLYGSDNAFVVVANAVLERNSASTGAGVYVSGDGVLALLNSVLHGNEATGRGGGLYVASSAQVSLDATVIAFNSAGQDATNLFSDSDQVAAAFSCFFDSSGDAGLLGPVTGDFMVQAPGFIGDSDYHLDTDSPLIDAGDPADAFLDTDGTRNDIGAYGGPSGASWDLDGDGYYDYFWPGGPSDPPALFSEDAYDCDDQDPSVHTGCNHD